jgi:site-specific DNA-methyltransferase (adenine-specific)
MTFREEQIGPCRLILGDCLEVLPGLARVDAVVTDPPYGVNLQATSGSGGKHGLRRNGYASFVDSYENFVSEIVPRLNAALATAQRAAVFTGPHIHEQSKPSVVGGVFCPAGSGRHTWGFKTFLPVLFYGTAPNLNLGGRQTTCLSTAQAEPSEHPCPKPVEWMHWLTVQASDIHHTILDPFMGSGTTGVACIKTDRQFIGIELEEKYFDIACRRIERAWRLKCSELPFDPPPVETQPELFGETA